jgi:hypothetical protein
MVMVCSFWLLLLEGRDGASSIDSVERKNSLLLERIQISPYRKQEINSERPVIFLPMDTIQGWKKRP